MKNNTLISGLLILSIIISVLVMRQGWSETKHIQAIPFFKIESDSLLMMSLIKNSSEGNYIPFLLKSNPHLGAPFVANLNDWPITEDILIYILGILSRLLGLVAACNIGLIASYLLSGLSFFFVCRYLRYNFEWSIIGSIAFSLSPYSFYRSFNHIVLTYYWHIPLFILVYWLIVSKKGLRFNSRTYWFSIGVALITGVQNPYYTNIFLQFLVIAFFVTLVRGHSISQIAPLVTVALTVILTFISMNLDTLIYCFNEGRNSGCVSRNYAALELYALKPLELFLPPSGNALSAFNSIYLKYTKSALTLGEIGSQYLGILSILSLIYLAIKCFIKFSKNTLLSLPSHALLIFWIFAYSIVGGLNGFIGLLGFQLFRGTNRYSIVIMCLALLYLVKVMPKTSRILNKRVRLSILLLAFSIIYFDQVPNRRLNNEILLAKRNINSDKSFTLEMEKMLPANALVFQLPYLKFPESGPICNMEDYSHFRPYIYSKSIHFSYGDTKGRATDEWMDELSKKPTIELVYELERTGFSAIYINKSGFEDRGKSLLDELNSLGYSISLESSDGDLALVRINASPNPSLPVSVSFSDGFYNKEKDLTGNDWRWCLGNGKIVFHNWSSLSKLVHSSFIISGVSPEIRELIIKINKSNIIRRYVSSTNNLNEIIDFPIKPGLNTLEFEPHFKSVKIGYDIRDFSFQIKNYKFAIQ